jgi:TrmH family RNA methyltransferase
LSGNAARGPDVVLVSPRRGANVGAACRAIRNFAAGRLVVVDGDYDVAEARRTAVHGADVLDARIDAASLEEAVAASAVVIGTSPRDRPWNLPSAPIAEVFAWARVATAAPGDVALVFGPESRGLSNSELSLCHRVAYVPTGDEYTSLNLAQAVVVCLYEWGRPAPAEAAAAGEPGRLLAPGADQRAALADLGEVLEEVGFLHGDQAERVMGTVASMFARNGLDEREVRILRGIARQVRWAARRGKE